MSDPLDIVDRAKRSVEALRQRASDDGDASRAEDLGKMSRAADELRVRLIEMPTKLAAASPQEKRSLCHDMRTPVNHILGYCELLQEEAEDDDDHTWLSALREVATTAKELKRAVDNATAGDVALSDSGSLWPRVEGSRRERGGTILVVDDNTDNVELLTRLLERDGFRVVAAGDGSQALALMRREAIDVVLLDIMMPVMDGYETLTRLKEDGAWRHIPVIMLSSLKEQQSIARCIEHGAEDHLPKPFDPVLLRARIGNSLEKKRVHDLERGYMARIVAEKKRADDLIDGVIPIGVALAHERDLDRLLERVLHEAKRFCGADGGRLYLRLDANELDPVLATCDSLLVPEESLLGERIPLPKQGEPEGRLAPVVAAAVRGETVNLNLSARAGYDLSAVSTFDAAHEYKTRCLLALPLELESGVAGVLELWNATTAGGPEEGSFDGALEVLTSLSALAAVALEGYRREQTLKRQIRQLEIRIDEARRKRQVADITESEYFKRLRAQAKELRAVHSNE